MRHLLLPLLSLVCSVAAAQTKDTTDIFYKHLELDELVITGLAGESKLKETPSAVSVVSARELRSQAGTNIISTISRVPGVSQITTGGGISKPVIRGLGYNRVVVVNDGIRQEGQQWGDEHGVEIDDSSVHSVEIIKGPASLMYGSDALAGVLIFHPEPLPMLDTVTGGLETEYQTNNGLINYSLHAAGNHGGWLWGARFSDKYAHAYSNRADGAVPNSGFRQRAASAMLGRNGDWGYTRLRMSWYRLIPGMIEGERDPLSGVLTGGSTGYSPELPFQQVSHYKLVSDNTFYLGPGSLKALVGWQQNRRKEFEESASEPGLDFRLNTLDYDLRYQLQTSGGWKAAAGVGGMLQRSENLGDEYLIPAYRLADAGIFATAGKSLENWTFTGGLRADLRMLASEALDGRFEAFERSFPGLSASLGAVRTFGRNVTLRANLSRGFRAPNLSELGSNGEHEGTFRYELGNKDLKPEYSLQGDLGLDFSGRFVSVQASAFVSRIDNYIYLTKTAELSPEGAPVYSYGSGTAHLRGGEVSLDIHPIHSLHIGSAFSCVFADDDAGMPLPFIPAPRLFNEVKYEITHGKCLFSNAFVAVDLDWTMPQDRYLPGTETPSEGYLLLGASAGTDVIVKGKRRASLYLIATNLTDRVYQNHLSRLKYAGENPLTGRSGIFEMGRNIVLKLVIPI